jgi:hypothetical protein
MIPSASTSFLMEDSTSNSNSLCTIREALLVEKQKLHPSTSTTSTSGDDNCPRKAGRGGVDIVGIVLNVSFQIFHDKVLTFLITDSSLPNGCFVKVTLRGDNTNTILSKVMNGSIQQGDVVRCNSLALRRNNYHSSTNDDTLLFLGEFHICHQPAPTIPCFKLGSLLLPPPTLQTTQQKQQKEAVLEDCESTVFDLVEDKFVPLDMITPRTLVRDLLIWYYATFHNNVEPMANYNRLSIDTIGPCKRRKLHEITSPNLMSDIVVQIHSFYNNTINSTAANTRRKWGQCSTLVAFAVVCDGEQEEDFAVVQILSISNHYQHLSSTLQRCTSQGHCQECWVLLRQVLSQSNAYIDDLRQRQNYYYRCRQQLLLQGNPNNDTGNMILVTTSGTTVSILHENPYKKMMNQVQQCSLPNRSDLMYDDPSPTNSPPSLPSHNHLLVPQLHHYNSDSKSLSYNNFSPNQPFYANLFNIYFSNLDFYLLYADAGTKSNYNHKQNKTYKNKFRVAADREKLISMISSPPLNTTSRSTTRSVTLILKYSESLPNKCCSLYQQSHNGMIHVIANEEIMELLFGSEARSTRIPHHHSS